MLNKTWDVMIRGFLLRMAVLEDLTMKMRNCHSTGGYRASADVSEQQLKNNALTMSQGYYMIRRREREGH